MIAQVPPAFAPIPIRQPSVLREYGGWLAFNRFDPTTRGYRLTVRAPSGVLTDLLPAVRGGYEFDLGPDAAGHPAVVYSLCRREDCDLYTRALTHDARPRPIPGANTRARERNPTLWRGTLAWSRGSAIYVKRASMPARRVAAVPPRRCPPYTETRACHATTRREVRALELRGGRLAADISYLIRAPGLGGALHEDEVRVIGMRSGRVRQIAEQEPGEGDEQWVGLSFDARHLAFYRSCDGDVAACGAYRYDLRTGRYELAPSGQPHRGFALVGTAAYVTPRRCLRAAGCAIRRILLTFRPACEPRRAALRRRRC